MKGLLAKILLCPIVLAIGACGVTFDTVYSLGDKKTSLTVPASAATGESETRTEYQASPGTMPGLQLGCYQRTRSVERGWSVTKHYEYRGGWEEGTYLGAAVADGILGALVAGSLAGICLSDKSDLSCVNIAWAAPFAADLIYSLVRHHSARPKVLVDKARSADQMQYGEAAQEEVTACQSVAGLYLGGSTGPSDEQLLNGYAGNEVRELGEDAMALGFDEMGAVILSDEAINYWASRNWASLWVRDTQGALQPVAVDRCTVLRPHSSRMESAANQSFQSSCPLPQPAQ